MKGRLNKGDIVQSFKREIESSNNKYLYRIIDIASHSEDLESYIVYQALYEPYGTWIRPYHMFMSEVEHEKYPDIKQKYRFEKVDEEVVRDLLATRKTTYEMDDLIQIVASLRGEHGCQWDKKQTFESMKKCLLDETAEVIEAIDNRDMDNLCEELGDVLLQVIMNGQIASEEGCFSIHEIVDGVSKKLIRRHPHVFGDKKPAKTPEEAYERWQEMKRIEKASRNSK